MATVISRSALKAIIADMPLKYRVINSMTARFGYVAFPRHPLMEALGFPNCWEERLRGGAE